MIRVLVMIAVAGFVLCVASLSAAVAIGGPDAVARGGWAMFSGDWKDGRIHHRWRNHHGYGDNEWSFRKDSPEITRTLAWSGAQGLNVDLPAEVRYIQQNGPATVTVTGPQDAVGHVIVRGDSIRYDSRGWHRGHRLSIVVRAPNINSFNLSGANELSIEGYRQDTLDMDVSGSAEVIATGETGVISLDISGDGDVDLGGLKTKGAAVEISGAGDAVVAPTDWAKLDISGMGDIRLLTHPPKLETDVTGAGTIHQGEASPSSSPSPTPTPSPQSSKL